MNNEIVYAVFGLPGGMEWLIIGGGLLLLFGGKKIPELMKGLGSGIKEFKKASTNNPEDTKKIEENKSEA